MLSQENSPLPIAATFSKDARFFAAGFEPTYLTYGDGANVHGSDGRMYLDWVSGLGANLLGYLRHADDSPRSRWVNQVQLALNDGAGFSLPHVLERQVADKLVAMLAAHVPGWKDQPLGVRFGLSGSDACSMAVRLARAATGRSYVVSVGYHGWHDMFVALTPPAWGIPEGSWIHRSPFMRTAPFGKVKVLENEMHPWSTGNLAAVIIEQPPQEPLAGYWHKVRKLCTEHGALLILDEVVTGLRFGLGGAAEVYGIEPDIVCMGKGLGNGIPISAMVGRREYFDWFDRKDPVFVSSTHFGNAVSLAAADAVLDVWTPDCVNYLWSIGKLLKDGLRDAGYEVVGQAPRFLVQHESLAHRAFFTLGMRDRGILANRPYLPNLAHSLEDVDRTVRAAADIKAEMARVDVNEAMRGREPMVLFEGR